MRSTPLGLACGFLVLLAVPGAGFAHHSISATYDPARSVDLDGLLTSVRLINPHALFEIEVTGAGGAKTIWTVESRGPAGISRMGLNESHLKIGDRVRMSGSPARSGENALWLQTLETGGRTYAMDGHAPATP